ncbi:hypothetical protein PR202_gb21107 [Eleusine coracana subsp. coracana]|uniref:Glucan endo-1,3-beta-D-glucosidase n=1 Tax=Eleusine coracana subsp. coracana TaxID=191504 RepID=A0AAV5FAC3_ELECO|nr:hypothetical protein PR202_gb21107 [Eleusine coracana subsp. coracana]
MTRGDRIRCLPLLHGGVRQGKAESGASPSSDGSARQGEAGSGASPSSTVAHDKGRPDLAPPPPPQRRVVRGGRIRLLPLFRRQRRASGALALSFSAGSLPLMKIMAFSRLRVFILGAAFLLLLSATAGEMGVNYGVVADNLPDTQSVVRLLKDNGITMVRIYNTDPAVLRSLANTGMKVMVMMPNEKVADAARDPSIAGDWVWNQVAVYLPATQINGVAIGNEVFDSAPALTSVLVQAMKNVHAALANLGLADTVKVTTPIAFSAVDVSFPPSDGRFRPDIAWSVMKPMLDFLDQTGSFLSMNFYPFFAFNDPANQINRDYAVGNPNNPGVQDPKTGLMYSSLLDAQRDATYYAMAKLGFSGSSNNSLGLARGVPVKQSVPESGWPTRGQVKKGGRLGTRVGSDGGAATVANAQAYINNLINRVVSGNTGTPLHPDADMDVYIFALFNENKKGSGPDDIEQNFRPLLPEHDQGVRI